MSVNCLVRVLISPTFRPSVRSTLPFCIHAPAKFSIRIFPTLPLLAYMRLRMTHSTVCSSVHGYCIVRVVSASLLESWIYIFVLNFYTNFWSKRQSLYIPNAAPLQGGFPLYSFHFSRKKCDECRLSIAISRVSSQLSCIFHHWNGNKDRRSF